MEEPKQGGTTTAVSRTVVSKILQGDTMTVTVRVPTTLRSLTSGAAEVVAVGGTLADVLNFLESEYPGFCRHILNDDGELNKFVNIFISDEDARFLGGLSAPVGADDTVSVVPAVAGGCFSLLRVRDAQDAYDVRDAQD